MPRKQVETTIADDAVFRFQAIARAEGQPHKGGLRITIPARIVRGLRHLGWGGRWINVELESNSARWLARVRPHPSALTFSLPRRLRGDMAAGDMVSVAVWMQGDKKERGP